jgi:hypothetical protein
MSVSCECCVLSGRGLYDGLITRQEYPSECAVSNRMSSSCPGPLTAVEPLKNPELVDAIAYRHTLF